MKEKFQGRNRPNRIYVGKTLSEISENFIKVKDENQTTGSMISSTPDVRNTDTNKNNILNYKSKKNSFANYDQRDYSNIDWDSLYEN